MSNYAEKFATAELEKEREGEKRQQKIYDRPLKGAIVAEKKPTTGPLLVKL